MTEAESEEAGIHRHRQGKELDFCSTRGGERRGAASPDGDLGPQNLWGGLVHSQAEWYTLQEVRVKEV